MLFRTAIITASVKNAPGAITNSSVLGNASGSTVSISNVSQYNVLTVKRGKGTANRTTLDITVSNKNVTGAIKEIDTDYVNINGTEYRL